jgi:hypothetical protein
MLILRPPRFDRDKSYSIPMSILSSLLYGTTALTGELFFRSSTRRIRSDESFTLLAGTRSSLVNQAGDGSILRSPIRAVSPFEVVFTTSSFSFYLVAVILSLLSIESVHASWNYP